MTESLPVLHQEPAREIARADVDSWTTVIAEVSRFAKYVADTDFVPRSLRGNPAAVTAAIVAGREAGLPPLAALTQTFVVNGVPSLSAKAKRALVLAAGHDIEVLEQTGAICRVRSRRRNSERWSIEVTWTIDMAKAAGLTSKDNWKHHPRQMLFARACGELCDRDFPDVVFGFATAEDLRDEDDEQSAAEALSAPRSTSTVARKRGSAKKTAAAAPPPLAPPTERPQAPQGPPLPGEPGFDDLSGGSGRPEGSGGVSVGGSPSESGASVGEPEGEAGEPTDANEVDDEVVVEELPDDAEPTRDDDPEARVDQPAEEQPKAGPRKITRAQSRMVFARLGELGVSTEEKGREDRMHVLGALVGHPIDSSNGITHAEAQALIDTLARFEDGTALRRFIAGLDQGSDS